MSQEIIPESHMMGSISTRPRMLQTVGEESGLLPVVVKLLGQCLGPSGAQTAQGHPNYSHMSFALPFNLDFMKKDTPLQGENNHLMQQQEE